MDERAVRAHVMTWIDEAIIGLNLCPFAKDARAGGGVTLEVSDAQTPHDALRDALQTATTLLDHDEQSVRVLTTLLVYPWALDDFELYLDVIETLSQILSDAGGDGVLQVATFHPEYQFAGVNEEDISHYTNRSPYPIIHFLREVDVTRALSNYSEPERIPDNNIARLEALGNEGIATIWSRWTEGSSLASETSDELG